MSRKPGVQSKRARRTKLAGGGEYGDNGALKKGVLVSELREQMRELGRQLTAANLILFAFMLVAQVPSTAYLFMRLESPPGFELLYTFGALYTVGYWLEVDSRKYNFRWPYCRGVFLHIAAFFIVPYYLFKTRGKYAFLTLLIFFCLYLLTSFIGMLIAILLIGSRFD